MCKAGARAYSCADAPAFFFSDRSPSVHARRDIPDAGRAGYCAAWRPLPDALEALLCLTPERVPASNPSGMPQGASPSAAQGASGDVLCSGPGSGDRAVMELEPSRRRHQVNHWETEGNPGILLSWSPLLAVFVSAASSLLLGHVERMRRGPRHFAPARAAKKA